MGRWEGSQARNVTSEISLIQGFVVEIDVDQTNTAAPKISVFFTDGHNTGKQQMLQVIERSRCALGIQPYFQVNSNNEALDQGDLACDVERKNPFPAGSTYRESATCSNRGVCDQSTGRCNCFDGYFGLACDHVNTYI